MQEKKRRRGDAPLPFSRSQSPPLFAAALHVCIHTGQKRKKEKIGQRERGSLALLPPLPLRIHRMAARSTIRTRKKEKKIVTDKRPPNIVWCTVAVKEATMKVVRKTTAWETLKQNERHVCGREKERPFLSRTNSVNQPKHGGTSNAGDRMYIHRHCIPHPSSTACSVVTLPFGAIQLRSPSSPFSSPSSPHRHSSSSTSPSL